ncbi:MAG TPA: phosphatase PAP2 family protein [Candidatus Baltobacteraceae bacterium]|nr:phosphatase PAP2 family protein [Candidatus Baltobacteraceae bacterium]
MSLELRLWIAAAALFALFVALGLRVMNRPLERLDAEAIVFRGQLTHLALIFTRSGRSRQLTVACVAAIAVYAALRLPIFIPLLITGSQILTQILVEYCKTLFKRMRPDYWLVGLEAGHSYPSGHATTAVVFFIGWAAVVAMSALPGDLKSILIAALTLWALGIVWSRLALGAHYLTDVTGGALFGAAWLCALFTTSSHFYVSLR